jgi:two-component system, cell cycle sensor histidine kinase and response regulator CckA
MSTLQQICLAPIDRTRTVLIADDEIGIRALLTVILQRNGFQVLSARDGEEAVEIFKARPREIGTVLLDVQMPRRNGPDAAKIIRDIQPDVRIIMSSGMLKSELQSRYGVEAPWTFLAKPFSYDSVSSVFPQPSQ